MQYTLSCFRDHGGDTTGIYMEESWGQKRGAHSKDYGAHVWNVTLLCEWPPCHWMTQTRVVLRARGVFGIMCPRAPEAAPTKQLDNKEYPDV